MQPKTIDTVIVVCKKCDGQGWLSTSKVTSSKGDRYVSHEPCEPCKGNGLFEKTITTITKPFVRKRMPKDYSY